MKVCLCGNEIEEQPSENGLIPVCEECQEDGQFEGED